MKLTLARVREMLAMWTERAEAQCEEPSGVEYDLARDVLTLADALETAERERDASREAWATLAAVVRAYLAAEETLALVVADDHTRTTYREWAARHGAAMDAVDASRAALVAGVAMCAP